MFDVNKDWPFWFSRQQAPRFGAIVLLILVALFFLDAATAVFAAGLPGWVHALFNFITTAGDAEWVLLPSLGVALSAGAAGALAGRLKPRSAHPAIARKISSLATFVFFCTAGPGLLANLLKRLIGRARPVHFEELGIASFQPILNDWSFQSIPSGHAATMFAFAMAMAFLFPALKNWLLLLAALVGISRVVIGMHFPSDVFAGVIVGTFAAYGVRNFCLSRGWIFVRDEEGRIRPRPELLDLRSRP